MNAEHTEHPSDRRARAVAAAERCAELVDYETFSIAHSIVRAEEGARLARTREARLRLRRLSDALHDIAMRGES